MSRVDFVIGNDGHHTQAVLPVIRRLRETTECQCRVASLCELRGLASPAERYALEGISFEPLIPFRLRASPASGTSPEGDRPNHVRRFARHLLWHSLLRWTVRKVFATHPDLVVIPNDGAFPYDRICRWLARRNIPSLVLQEGIRFETPTGNRQDGSSATAFAVWGETSRDYYHSRGAPTERIYETGAPRLDAMVRADWSPEAAALRNRLQLGGRTLLLLSNPIDDMGYVTSEFKIALIRRFVSAQTAFLEEPGSRLVVKLHRRESLHDIKTALSDLPLSSSILVVQDIPLHPLLQIADGAVVFASTVGLEALLFDVRLAILELPEHGFVHDFVSSGAATPLRWNRDLGQQVAAWLAGPRPAAAVSRYLASTLANQGTATEAVAELIMKLLRSHDRGGCASG